MRVAYIRRWQAFTCSLAMSVWSAAGSTADLPNIAHEQGHHALMVDGAPFTVMAAQIHNSSAWPAVLPEVWPSIEALHANTLEAPIYWEQFEPAPDHFDYTHIDTLLAQSRDHGVRLILLWFGSWKNGQMHYAPDWIKTDPSRYPRALDSRGQPVDDLSPFAQANLEADRHAFAALLHYLKQVDGQRHTVIMVQVENEPGMLGAIRDHGADAEAAFRAAVPAPLRRALGKPAGNWDRVFAGDADEAFNAYAVARYIDQVAAAGKAEYDLPMYVNVWLRYKGKHLPGKDYPSGGATWNVLPIWKATASHVDLYGTDLYTTDAQEFGKVVAQYTRPDNPPWISETGFETANAPYFFNVLAQGGIGFSVFGVDHEPATPANIAAIAAHARNFALIGAIQRQVAAAAFHGRLLAAVEKAGQPRQTLSLDAQWSALISFGAPSWGEAPARLAGNRQAQGHVLLIREGPRQFLLAGFDARVEFQRRNNDGRHGQLLRVEEGRFADVHWVLRRRWNGDETDYGLNLGARPCVLRITLNDY